MKYLTVIMMLTGLVIGQAAALWSADHQLKESLGREKELVALCGQWEDLSNKNQSMAIRAILIARDCCEDRP